MHCGFAQLAAGLGWGDSVTAPVPGQGPDRRNQRLFAEMVSRTFYANNRWSRRPSPWPGAGAVTNSRPVTGLGEPSESGSWPRPAPPPSVTASATGHGPGRRNQRPDIRIECSGDRSLRLFPWPQRKSFTPEALYIILLVSAFGARGTGHETFCYLARHGDTSEQYTELQV